MGRQKAYSSKWFQCFTIQVNMFVLSHYLFIFLFPEQRRQKNPLISHCLFDQNNILAKKSSQDLKTLLLADQIFIGKISRFLFTCSWYQQADFLFCCSAVLKHIPQLPQRPGITSRKPSLVKADLQGILSAEALPAAVPDP